MFLDNGFIRGLKISRIFVRLGAGKMDIEKNIYGGWIGFKDECVDGVKYLYII